MVACEKTHSGNSQSCWAVLDFEVFVQNFAVPLVFSCPETSQGANDVVKDSSDENQPSFKSSQEHICRLHALFNEYGHCLGVVSFIFAIALPVHKLFWLQCSDLKACWSRFKSLIRVRSWRPLLVKILRKMSKPFCCLWQHSRIR